MILNINGKCSDMSGVQIYDGDKCLIEHEGYMASLSFAGGGDYIDISIDMETGKVIGFNKQEVLDWMKNPDG